MPARNQVRRFEEEFASLLPNLVADLVRQFEAVQKLAPERANGQRKSVNVGQDVLKPLDDRVCAPVTLVISFLSCAAGHVFLGRGAWPAPFWWVALSSAMTLFESLVGVFPVVSPNSLPGSAPVIAYFDGGNGSDSAKPFGTLDVEGNRPVPTKFPDRAQFLRIK